jgi:transposase-like protein
MKTKEPTDLTLIKIIDQFPTDDAAREHLEGIRWKEGVKCPHCKCSDQSKFSTIAPNPEKKVRAGLRWCANCEKQFTVTIGTIFEDSHVPLRKWLVAWYLICSSKKGISSLQLQRNLELGSYRTALFMAHRIRFALKDPSFREKLSGTIEVDETYIGGKQVGIGQSAMSKSRNDTLLQCPLPPIEALRRALMVEPPREWKKPVKISKPSKKKAAR